MELLLSKEQRKILSVLINVSGKIIYSDRDSILPDNGIFDIVDKNEILKLSMHENTSEHLLSSLKGYKSCVATVVGKGIGKHIWLCFISDKIYNDAIKDGRDINKMLKACVDKSSKPKKVNIDLFVSKAVKTMAKEGICIEKGECISAEYPISLKTIKIMMIDAASILYGVSMEETITVDADITDYGARISMWIKAENIKTVRGVVDFCENYPTLSTNIIYMNTLASKEGIELDFSLENGICKISFTYPMDEIWEFDVLTSDMYDEEENIKYIIDTFFINK